MIFPDNETFFLGFPLAFSDNDKASSIGNRRRETDSSCFCIDANAADIFFQRIADSVFSALFGLSRASDSISIDKVFADIQESKNRFFLLPDKFN